MMRVGMYNTVIVPCPNCGAQNRLQTKTGNCMLAVYNISEVPQADMIGIMGRTIRCINCDIEIDIEEEKIKNKDYSHLVNVKEGADEVE